ncbi:MAG TPA: hypothetical protein VEA80_05445 [Vitreimonas sp.]|uniref:hypothetical protein n=1 Tax=Vitreimonas sp. TaxID=3069702 RepID=UPI002D511156|nr:hypothetical protein [Vitreimonas sp.]HYD86897.1 hypothetical protein [Vitreimonas sp.]
MLLYIWFAVMMQAFVPGGDRIASYQSGAFESHLRTQIDAPALVGAAGHMARYTPLVARAR